MGPNESAFRAQVQGSKPAQVGQAGTDWLDFGKLLINVVTALNKSAQASEALGGDTGPMLAQGFRKAAQSVGDRADDLFKGAGALRATGLTMGTNKDNLEALDKDFPPIDPPGAFQPDSTAKTDGELKAESDRLTAHNKAVTAANDRATKREELSRTYADSGVTVFNDSTEVMKQIHGIPDPEQGAEDPAMNPGAQPWGSAPTGTPIGSTNPTGTVHPTDPTNTGHPTPTDTGVNATHPNDPLVPIPHGDPAGPTPDVPAPNVTSVTPEVTASGTPTTSNINPATLGVGAVGAGALAAGIKGGLSLPSALSSRGAASIGSTARSAVSGALGRSSAATAGSPTSASRSGVAGRGGSPGIGGQAGRSAGGRGAGGRGAGGRGAGAGGTGAGRGGKDKKRERGSDRDLFDDGEDWIDDEGAAPGVLD